MDEERILLVCPACGNRDLNALSQKHGEAIRYSLFCLACREERLLVTVRPEKPIPSDPAIVPSVLGIGPMKKKEKKT